MRKSLLITLLSICALGTAHVAVAAAHGGGAAMHTDSPAHGNSVANSNGVKSVDRDKGLSRAEDRRNGHSINKKHLRRMRHKK